MITPNLPVIVSVTDKLINRYRFTPDPTDQNEFVSILGTPVFSNLEFMKVSGTSLDNSQGVGLQNGNSEVFIKIDTVLFTVTGSKNIIKTPIVGRRGTVKEYVSMGDYQINVKGAIVSLYPNVYPEDEVRLLIELLELPKALPIASKFLDMFNITSFVVDPEFTISEKLGSRNEVPFEFNAISDFPDDFELSISS